MSELRAARERAGLTLAEVSTRTKIPQRYLEALERGDVSAFPPGPFLSGYTRQYRTFLELPATGAPPVGSPASAPRRALPEEPMEPTVTEPAAPGRRSRRRALQLGVLGALVATSAVLATRIAAEIEPSGPPALGVTPDQVVTLAVLEPVRARVEVDGRTELDGSLLPGPTRTFAGHDRVAVELETLVGVTIGYNGDKLVPLGARSLPRRVVFVDDAGAPPGE